MDKKRLIPVLILCVVTALWAQIKISCIGNSITSGGTGGPGAYYPPKLQTLLGSGYIVENDGVSGTTLLKNGDVSYWKNGKLPQVFAFKPDIITIKLGTNDTKQQNWDPFNQYFKRDYLALIDTLNGTLKKRPQIYVVLPVPIWSNTYGIRDSALQKIIPIIRQIATERGLGLIDANTPLLNFQKYFADGVHPDSSGCDTIANVIYRTLTASAVSRFAFRTHSTAQGALPYRLFIPNNYNRQIKYPLILTLHGVGESGTDNVAQITNNRVAEIWAQDSTQGKQQCFIASPQCPTTRKWVEVAAWTNVFYKTDSIAQSVPLTIALSMLDSLIKEFPIDTNRLYVTGLSMGGFGTWDLITRHPTKFAAAIPMSGGCDTSKASLIKNIPIWAFHGAQDPTVPPAGTRTMATLLKNKGGALLSYTAQYNSYFANSTVTRAALGDSITAGKKLLYCEYTDGAHDIWTKSYNDPLLEQWLFMQKKLPVTSTDPVKTNSDIKKELPALFPFLGTSSLKPLFSHLEPGVLYDIEIFDAKGVFIARKNFASSTFSKAAIRSLIGSTPGIQIIKLTKLDKKF